MLAKDDKDGQIALLKETLEKIRVEAKDSHEWNFRDICRNIERTAETALFDVTF